MALKIRKVDYFYTTVKDQPGEGFKLLNQLAEIGVNLLAFTAVPLGPMHTQLTIVPEDSQFFLSETAKAGLTLDGPHPALLTHGDDELGALAAVHQTLYENNVNVYASSGVAHANSSYSYLLYVKPEDFEAAAKALGLDKYSSVYHTELS